MSRPAFEALADRLDGWAGGADFALLAYEGEDTDFVRVNHARVRQAGHVRQGRARLTLIRGQRQVAGSCAVSGEPRVDRDRLAALSGALRERLDLVPPDPYLLYCTEPHRIERAHTANLPASAEAIERLCAAAAGLDLVGIWVAGTTEAGFASSAGARGWTESASFNLDWSLHGDADRAVKRRLAGNAWDPAGLEQQVAAAREELAQLELPFHALEPGGYRCYLAPAAVAELLSMLGWGGFGLKSQRTHSSPLLRLLRDEARLAPAVTLHEAHAAGLGPPWTEGGFIKPSAVVLVTGGRPGDALAAEASAAEFGAAVNAAVEVPESLQMHPGELAPGQALAALGRGVWVSDLWYLNYSDRIECRITGMTRFACFWVEGGRVVAPIRPMRLDDSVYRILGAQLLALTSEREYLIDPGTYGGRSHRSVLVPGALVGEIRLTL